MPTLLVAAVCAGCQKAATPANPASQQTNAARWTAARSAPIAGPPGGGPSRDLLHDQDVVDVDPGHEVLAHHVR